MAKFLQLHVDRCQWRTRLTRNDLPIVKANDGDIAGNGDIAITQGINDAAGNLVATAKYAVRARAGTRKNDIDRRMTPFFRPLAVHDFGGGAYHLAIGIRANVGGAIILLAGNMQDPCPSHLL